MLLDSYGFTPKKAALQYFIVDKLRLSCRRRDALKRSLTVIRAVSPLQFRSIMPYCFPVCHQLCKRSELQQTTTVIGSTTWARRAEPSAHKSDLTYIGWTKEANRETTYKTPQGIQSWTSMVRWNVSCRWSNTARSWNLDRGKKLRHVHRPLRISAPSALHTTLTLGNWEDQGRRCRFTQWFHFKQFKLFTTRKVENIKTGKGKHHTIQRSNNCLCWEDTGSQPVTTISASFFHGRFRCYRRTGVTFLLKWMVRSQIWYCWNVLFHS